MNELHLNHILVIFVNKSSTVVVVVVDDDDDDNFSLYITWR